MKWGVVCIIQLFSVFVLGQKEITFRWNFNDPKQEVLMEDFYVTISKGKVLYFADSVRSNDEYKWNVSAGENLHIRINSKYYLPIDTLFRITEKNIKRGLVNLNFYIQFTGQDLDVVDIRAYYQPAIVYSSEEEHVADFEMDTLGQLVLLVYEKKLPKSAKIILRKEGNTDRVMRCPSLASHLEKDYLGRIYLKTEDANYLVHTVGDIGIQKIDQTYYEEKIKPIASEYSEKVFFSNYNPLYPAVDYFAVDKKDSSYKNLLYVEDAEIMEHYRAEYKYVDVRTKLWAWDMEIASGIDREVWVGAAVFTNSLYYEPPFVPFFRQCDTAYISDHYKNQLYKFTIDSEIELVDSIAINYHLDKRKTGWRRVVLQDPITEKAYLLYDKAGYSHIRELHPHDGSLSSVMTLFYRYVEKVAVYDNEVYYIYRPFGSIQKKYLYKESLRFE
ncbi:MAG: hypothetical protein JJT77_01510 [Crocinitomicaceae bacterium]|nr:hypothetical protein [Crocinitomicaceae bacterium]